MNMNKIFLALGLMTVTLPPAIAQHGYRRGWYPAPHHYHYNWVAPVVIGGVIGYGIARYNQPVIVQQYPAAQQPPVIVQNANCSPWTEVQQPDGSIVKQRTCTQ